MFVCATIFYFGETPEGYDLLKENDGHVLKPAPGNGDEYYPPLLSASLVNGNWNVVGTDDTDVKRQVIKLLEMQNLLDLPDSFSAAS